MSSSLQTYYWRGKNKHGKHVKGEQKARHLGLLHYELHKQGITGIKIRKQSQRNFFKAQIAQKDICIFSRQMTMLLMAGISFMQALELIAKENCKSSMKLLIEKIKTHIESGETIANVLRKYPKYFNLLYCNLIAAGESAGKLAVMFARVASHQEKIYGLKNKIKKALVYPVVVINVAIFITFGLLIFVVPQFEVLFSSFGTQLPRATQMIIHLSQWLQNYGIVFLALFSSMIGWIIYLKRHSIYVAEIFDKQLLNIPWLGTVLKKSAITKFARTLATLFAAGIPLTDALQIVAGTTGNIIYNKLTLEMHDSIIVGQTLSFSLQKTNLFPNFAIQMVALGEASGTLETMLNKLADTFEAEIDQIVSNLMMLLEPIIMLILGVVIGTLVIAMYLPIFKLGSVM